MPQLGFEPTISAGEQPQTYTLDRAATGDRKNIHIFMLVYSKFILMCKYYIK